jgi:hypothetical protein
LGLVTPRDVVEALEQGAREEEGKGDVEQESRIVAVEKKAGQPIGSGAG